MVRMTGIVEKACQGFTLAGMHPLSTNSRSLDNSWYIVQDFPYVNSSETIETQPRAFHRAHIQAKPVESSRVLQNVREMLRSLELRLY